MILLWSWQDIGHVEIPHQRLAEVRSLRALGLSGISRLHNGRCTVREPGDEYAEASLSTVPHYIISDLVPSP